MVSLQNYGPSLISNSAGSNTGIMSSLQTALILQLLLLTNMETTLTHH